MPIFVGRKMQSACAEDSIACPEVVFSYAKLPKVEREAE